jgi:two-component system sensor histidine kinase YesM
MQIGSRFTIIREWFLNLSLITKMFVLFALAGLIPLTLSFIVSYREISEFSLNNQKYMAKQGYEQTFKALSDQFGRISKLSTLIATNQNFNTSLKLIKTSRDFPEKYTEYKKLNANLSAMYFSTEYDSITYYVNSDFDADESMFPLFYSSETKEGSEVKKKLSENGDKSAWLLYSDKGTFSSGEYLSLGRYVSDMADYNQYIGILMVNIDLNKIRDTFILTVPEELVYIKAKDGQVIASSNDNSMMEMKNLHEIERQLNSDYKDLRINNKNYIACSRIIPNTNLELVAIIPLNSIKGSLVDSGKNKISFYLVMCIVMLFLIYAIAKSISKRILLLSRKVKGVESGTLDKLNIKEQKDEVGSLITNYNYMVDEIQSLLQQQFELGEKKKGAELKALQAQINPHFLYNTLDMINWMAQKNETENIRDTVFTLSKYYRLILNKGEDIITIGQEIELCNAYISIQQKRFKGRIQFKIDVEENIMQYLIPKITLQPLIENAIIHGISEGNRGTGTIIISGWEEDENIILSVTDDGIGKSSMEGAETKKKGSGYGIRNIEMRLTLFYGMEHCIKYESTEGIGTCVSLNIKKIKEK